MNVFVYWSVCVCACEYNKFIQAIICIKKHHLSTTFAFNNVQFLYEQQQQQQQQYPFIYTDQEED